MYCLKNYVKMQNTQKNAKEAMHVVLSSVIKVYKRLYMGAISGDACSGRFLPV